MSHWKPDWKAMMARAPLVAPRPAPGTVVFLADSHLGDARAPDDEFTAWLDGLRGVAVLVLLGDLFKVWLAPPKYWAGLHQRVMAALERLEARGTQVVLVVGNREYFLPRLAANAKRRGMPFGWVVHEACVLAWNGKRYGLTHGDLANRQDHRYLKWRKLSRGRLVRTLFWALPGPAARWLAHRIEASLAATNREIKIGYPQGELTAFAQAVTPGLDRFLIGHFHRQEVIRGGSCDLEIVPDWHALRRVTVLNTAGQFRTVDAWGISTPAAKKTAPTPAKKPAKQPAKQTSAKKTSRPKKKR
ncbi:MAG: metallophosphoesterase [Deltaproteobacteria bacterium]|nr:metallophosphoesterase [Deltaproteobacteria bacterium]